MPDDREAALSERGKEKSWINRIIENVGNFADAETTPKSGLTSLLRRTMSYALIIFATGLPITIAYVMIKSL